MPTSIGQKRKQQGCKALLCSKCIIMIIFSLKHKKLRCFYQKKHDAPRVQKRCVKCFTVNENNQDRCPVCLEQNRHDKAELVYIKEVISFHGDLMEILWHTDISWLAVLHVVLLTCCVQKDSCGSPCWCVCWCVSVSRAVVSKLQRRANGRFPTESISPA